MLFSLFSKIKFYLALAYYNARAPFDCQNFRLKILKNELRYLFITLGIGRLESCNKTPIALKTIFGSYHIHDVCWYLKVASPAFERLDLDELIQRVADALDKNHRIIFLDIGSQFGKYAIALGCRFKKQSKKLSIFAFEPDRENYLLLKYNIHLNKLKNITAFQPALSDKKSSKTFYYYAPQRMIVDYPTSKKVILHAAKLDSYLKHFSSGRNTDLFIKLDVEGHEIEVLKGATKTLQRFKNATLLVEDSLGAKTQELIRYLSAIGTLITKKTPYNSFWRLHSNASQVTKKSRY